MKSLLCDDFQVILHPSVHICISVSLTGINNSSEMIDLCTESEGQMLI